MLTGKKKIALPRHFPFPTMGARGATGIQTADRGVGGVDGGGEEGKDGDGVCGLAVVGKGG